MGGALDGGLEIFLGKEIFDDSWRWVVACWVLMKQESMDVSYVAQLARLDLSVEETAQFQAQLGQVLGYVNQLAELPVEGIEPTAHAAPQTTVFRTDTVLPSLPVTEALQNAPEKVNDLFRVPKVVE